MRRSVSEIQAQLAGKDRPPAPDDDYITLAKRLTPLIDPGESLMRYAKDKFLLSQRRYFAQPDARKFEWMTQNPYFSRTEKALLEMLDESHVESALEIGCGEGGNLVNLDRKPRFIVGVDLFESRCRFAREKVGFAHFVCADGFMLPLRDNSFDVVFCRDLLHHIVESQRLVDEMVRVCKPRGSVICIEAVGRNPVIFCLACAVRAERGLLRSTPARVARALSRSGLRDVRARMYQPLPIYRMLLHPRYGFPSLGKRPWFQRCCDAVERLAGRIVPRTWWGYTAVAGRKAG